MQRADEERDVEILRGQKLYTEAGVRTVVTTSAIAMHSDEDDSEGSDSEAEDLHTPLGVLSARGAGENGAAVQEKAHKQSPGDKRASAGKVKRNGKPAAAAAMVCFQAIVNCVAGQLSHLFAYLLACPCRCGDLTVWEHSLAATDGWRATGSILRRWSGAVAHGHYWGCSYDSVRAG